MLAAGVDVPGGEVRLYVREFACDCGECRTAQTLKDYNKCQLKDMVGEWQEMRLRRNTAAARTQRTDADFNAFTDSLQQGGMRDVPSATLSYILW